MDAIEFYHLVIDFFGPKATMPAMDRENRIVTCVLYESFNFQCEIDSRYEQFGAGIVQDGVRLTTFLGKTLQHDSDEATILRNLQVVDEWCQLRLPDKFLKAYNDAHGISTQ